MSNPGHLRSTDRDLLVAQRVLSGLRFPDKPELMGEKLEKRKMELKVRFVQESFGDGTSRTVPAKKDLQKMLAMFDLNVSFKMRNIPYTDNKYTAEVHFMLRNVPGVGMTKGACLEEAKERFRKYLVDGLRGNTKGLKDLFFKNVIVTWGSGSNQGTDTSLLEDAKQEVGEKFRLWIGNQLWKLDTPIRKKFFSAVKSEEVRASHLCELCGIRKLEHQLNREHLAEHKQLACYDCVPAKVDEEDAAAEDDEEDPDDDEDEEDDEAES